MIFDIFSGRRPAVPLAFCHQKSLKKMCRKKIIFLQMVFFTKWLMTKVDRSKNTYFLFCKIFIKSKCHSEKFDFIMLFPNLALTTLSKWILSSRKWVKTRLLAYFYSRKGFTTFLRSETTLTDRVYADYNLIALQALDTGVLEGCEFSSKFRAENIGRYEKTNFCKKYYWKRNTKRKFYI